MSTRRFTNSPIEQGEDESLAYTVDTSKWPGTGDPTGVSVTVKNRAGNDVSSSYLSGTASVSGDEITTPKIENLVDGASPYRLEVAWTKSGNDFEAWAQVDARE